MKKLILPLLIFFGIAQAFAQQTGNAQPKPSAAQLEWQKLENYAFIHFGQNTFNDVEWGYGDADPKNFNPTSLDTDQWAKALKEGGLEGVIITAKHHDGFCLWPSKYTDYTIAASPYKDGKGDIVGELAASARKYGLKFGVYLSPWDRHQATYGTPAYVEYYMNQLTELLTQYGEIFEVWLDGANGGDGYYGGAREERKIDRRSYYNFPAIEALVHKLQPNAIIFSDNGPGCRWAGNENALAGETNWSMLRRNEVYPGYDNFAELTFGHEDGYCWVPSENNCSIRPGRFYHQHEDDKVKTAQQLFDIYLKSVGRNGSFLLNLPPTKEGLIHPTDAANLKEYKHLKDAAFAHNLLEGAKAKASSQLSKDKAATCVLDGSIETSWAPKAGDAQPALSIKLAKPQQIKYVVIQEDIRNGQYIRKFAVEYRNAHGAWTILPTMEQTTTIGNKRILPVGGITANELRIRITDSRAPFAIREVMAY